MLNWKRKPIDERIQGKMYQLNSEGFILTMVLLGGSVLYQDNYLGLPFRDYGFEAIIFLIGITYIIIRNLISGVDLYGKNQKVNLILVLFVSFIFLGLDGYKKWSHYHGIYMHDGIGYFVAAELIEFVFQFAIIWLVFISLKKLNQIFQNRFNRKIDD